eukprot:tig00001310_g8153.t1
MSAFSLSIPSHAACSSHASQLNRADFCRQDTPRPRSRTQVVRHAFEASEALRPRSFQAYNGRKLRVAHDATPIASTTQPEGPDRSKLGPTDERFGPGIAMGAREVEEKLQAGNKKDKMLALTALRDLQPPGEAVRLLCAALEDGNADIRATAAFNLGAQRAFREVPETVPRLLERLGLDADYSVRASAAGALGYLEDARALDGLVCAVFEDTEWLVVFSAATALGNLRDARAVPCLLDCLDRADSELVQQAAIGALGEIRALEAVPRLLAFMTSPDYLVRQRLAEALGRLVCAASLEALQSLARDEHPNVRDAARISLRGLRTKEALDQIMQQISDSKAGARTAASFLGAGDELARMLSAEVARRRAEGPAPGDEAAGDQEGGDGEDDAEGPRGAL